MKPQRIEFVRRPRWLLVWFPTLVAVGAIAGWGFVRASAHLRAADAAVTRALEYRAQAQTLRAQAVKSAEAASAAGSAAVHRAVKKALQADLNALFATVENIAEPGTRLATLTMDASSGIVLIEYEMETMGQVAILTSAMNSGHSTPPWKLVSVNSVASNSRVASVAASAGKLRAQWQANLSEIK
jgi:hypothetical protein